MLKKFYSVKTEKCPTAWLAFAFVCFMLVFEAVRFDTNYSEYFVYLYDSPEIFSVLICAAFLLGSLVVFYYFTLAAFSAEARFKVVYFLMFVAALPVEYGYQKALGRFSNISDIESVVTTPDDQKLASVFLYFSMMMLIPATVFLLCLIFIRSKKPRGLKSFLATTAICAAFFAGLSVIGGIFIEKKFPTVSVAAFYRTAADFMISGPLANGKWSTVGSGGAMKRRQVEKPVLPESYRPANNIVLVLDESTRGDHFSLNGYARKTTPLLDDLAARNLLYNWGNAVSASTGSRFSFNSLITGLTPDDFPDKTEFKINTFPTIFQYAKAMNYTTYFFDGQMKKYWAGIPDDENYIDKWRGVNNFMDTEVSPKYSIDGRIAHEVNEVISNSKGNFIVIFTHGSHIPYQDDFPPDQAVFQPSYTTENKFDIPSAEYLPEVVNAYDNSIKYNVNNFFGNLVTDYNKIPNNTVILYTGDHGQTLFANGKSSHGGKTIAEADVPLLMIGKLDKKPDTEYRAAHCNIFPTLLDLMNYPENLRDKRNSISLLKAVKADSRPRFFNPDLGEKIPFD